MIWFPFNLISALKSRGTSVLQMHNSEPQKSKRHHCHLIIPFTRMVLKKSILPYMEIFIFVIYCIDFQLCIMKSLPIPVCHDFNIVFMDTVKIIVPLIFMFLISFCPLFQGVQFKCKGTLMFSFFFLFRQCSFGCFIIKTEEKNH